MKNGDQLSVASLQITRGSVWVASMALLVGLGWIVIFALGYMLSISSTNWWYVSFLILVGFSLILLILALSQAKILWSVTLEGIREVIEPASRLSLLVRPSKRLIVWGDLTGFSLGNQTFPYGRSKPQFKLLTKTGTTLSVCAIEADNRPSFDQFVDVVVGHAKAAGVGEQIAEREFLQSPWGRAVSCLLVVGAVYFIYSDLVAEPPLKWTDKARLYLVSVPFILWMALRSFR